MMWVESEDWPTWFVWHGHDWPTDDGVPPCCGPRCQVARRVVPWEGPHGEHKKCWRYQVFHGSHLVRVTPKPEVEDHKRRAAGDAE